MRWAAAGALALLLAGCTQAPGATPVESEVPSGSITVLAAASLTGVFEQLATEFEADHPGTEVVLSLGGSASLARQLVEGAPADVFAAANPETMQRVVDDGLAAAPESFASNTLQIVVPAGNPGGVESIVDFARPELALAICAVEVPCGAAAAILFDEAVIEPSADSLEQDVRAVLTRVVLGEVDAGIVYRTDALEVGDAVEIIDIPEADAAVNRYPIVQLDGAPNAVTAGAFIAFVLGERGQQALAEAGFGAP